MMRVALIGAAGQLGTELNQLLPQAVPLTRSELDLNDPAQPAPLLDQLSPEVVINTAACNLVDRVEDEPELAFSVNAFGVRRLAQWCQRNGAVLLHVSSDYVFGLEADRRHPYREEDAPGPLSAYGASKLAGEYFVQAECDRHFILRTCGLYGRAASRAKGNFVQTMLRLAETRDEIRVVDDQTCTPTSTRDLAEGISRLIQTGQYGLYHATNSGQTTWCGLAREIFCLRGLSTRVVPISSEEFGAKARRPRYSVLNCEKIAQECDIRFRPWQEALEEYLR